METWEIMLRLPATHCREKILSVTSCHCAEGKDHFFAKWFLQMLTMRSGPLPAASPPSSEEHRVSRASVQHAKPEARQQAAPCRGPAAAALPACPARPCKQCGEKGTFFLRETKPSFLPRKRQDGFGGCPQVHTRRQARSPSFWVITYKAIFIR